MVDDLPFFFLPSALVAALPLPRVVFSLGMMVGLLLDVS
jgi:hypothetical protein